MRSVPADAFLWCRWSVSFAFYNPCVFAVPLVALTVAGPSMYIFYTTGSLSTARYKIDLWFEFLSSWLYPVIIVLNKYKTTIINVAPDPTSKSPRLANGSSSYTHREAKGRASFVSVKTGRLCREFSESIAKPFLLIRHVTLTGTNL